MLICDISILHRYGKQRLDDILRPMGLTWQEAVLLIAQERVARADLQLLSQMLQTDKGNVSKLLKGMEQRGLLIRRPLKQDARRKEMVLSPQGQRLYPLVQEGMGQWEQACYRGLSDEQVRQFRALSRMIIDNIYPGAVDSAERQNT